jgi:hypothetical protein
MSEYPKTGAQGMTKEEMTSDADQKSNFTAASSFANGTASLAQAASEADLASQARAEESMTDAEMQEEFSLGGFNFVELSKNELHMRIPRSRYNKGDIFPLEFTSLIRSSYHQNSRAPFLSSRPSCTDSRLQFWRRNEHRGSYRGCQLWHFKKVSDTPNSYFILN